MTYFSYDKYLQNKFPLCETMMKRPIPILRNAAEKLFLSLHTTVICLIILCILVLWGTFYQIDHGIYAAKARFFSSWVVLIGGLVPFPGVRLTALILILNQIAFLLFRQKWRLEKLGLILTHAGILILLIGGGIISYTSKETFLTLWEGETSHESSSYREWELAGWKSGHFESPAVFSLDSLRPGQPLGNPSFSTGILIQRIYKNCTAFMPRGHGDMMRPMGLDIDSLAATRPAADPSENIAGMELAPRGAAAGRILLYGGNPSPTPAVLNGDSIFFSLRQKRAPLPLSITLIKFVKEDYAGTETARQFTSRIRAAGNGMDRDVVISMNKPFRYKQYTFYQSSYAQDGARQSSTLAVVENRGKALPYLAGLFMAAGLVLHFCVKLVVYIRKHRSAA